MPSSAHRDAPDSRTDADLVMESWRDPATFAHLFDRHHEVIHRYLWTRAGDAADDLAAEVFRIAFEQRRDYDPDHESARPWLFGIAANLMRQHHRRARRHRELEQRAHVEDPLRPVPDPQAHLQHQATTEEVAAVVTTLPRRDREPLLLHAWGDLSYDEVAAALDIPVGTVRSRIHRARTHLRSRLGDREDAGE